MGTSDSGVEYSYIRNLERLRRKAAIRVVVAVSAAGILLVLASWLAS